LADCNSPKKTIIQGKIHNINLNERDINVLVYKLGLHKSVLYLKADSTGDFKAEFETYIPTDAILQFDVNIPILVNPGDSIYILSLMPNPPTKSPKQNAQQNKTGLNTPSQPYCEQNKHYQPPPIHFFA
jgi:hypothetical protein